MESLQAKIINELNVKPHIDPAEEIEKRTNFLADYLLDSQLDGYVLGISGGQDSLLAGLLAQRAVNQLRINGQDVAFHALLLPYGTQADRADVDLAINTIQPSTVHEHNIKPAVDAYEQTYNSGEVIMSDFGKGNIKARQRMIAHYALAGELKLIVIGTDHAAEAVTGFYTKYGDGGADILPLFGLNKRQGKQLLRELNAPEQLITKQPTADLLDAKPGQTDESELGLSYDDIDDYLEGKVIDPTAAHKIEQRYLSSQHKRNLPVTPRFQ